MNSLGIYFLSFAGNYRMPAIWGEMLAISSVFFPGGWDGVAWGGGLQQKLVPFHLGLAKSLTA